MKGIEEEMAIRRESERYDFMSDFQPLTPECPRLKKGKTLAKSKKSGKEDAGEKSRGKYSSDGRTEVRGKKS